LVLRISISRVAPAENRLFEVTITMSMTSNVQQVNPDPVRDDLVSTSNVARPPSTYDELVRRSPQGSIFANRWWLDAVAPGMYELLEINKGGEVHAAWPVVHIVRDGAKARLYAGSNQKLGILFAPSTAKPVEVQSTKS
jgi:hypothetical protein